VDSRLKIVTKFAVKLQIFVYVSTKTRQHAEGWEGTSTLRWTTAVGDSFALKTRVHITVSLPGCEDITAGMEIVEKRHKPPPPRIEHP